jgi:methylmalonyl-CoA mutase, N-terminal domain
MNPKLNTETLEELKLRWQESAKKTRELERSFKTLGGEELDLLYQPDQDDGSYVDKLGFPGSFPFTRGVYPNMYRGRLWTMRQFAGFGSAEDTNSRYKYLLERGQTGLSVAFDMPTLMGYDSDHHLSRGEVGKCGVAISCMSDMKQLFDGIPLEKVSVSMTINGPAAVIFAYFIAAAEETGVCAKQLMGTLQNDILKEYQAQKEYIFPPKPSISLVVDTMEYCARHIPKWHAVSVSGYHIREAGSTAAQELAFTLANGFAYVEAALERGLDIDSFAPRLSFFWNSHSDFFEEIAKFRAARRIYARRMRDRYGAKNPRSMMLRFHTQTAGCSLTAQQPENNIIRTSFQALAAVLGGTQSLHTNSLDETLALPSEKAVKIALRTQQIIAEETGIPNVIDPLGGSYFVESLTDRMEERALAYFDRIEANGGVVSAIENGWFMKEIGDSSYRLHKEYERGQRSIVGIHKYVDSEEETLTDLLRIDESTEKWQRERLAQLRQTRDSERHEQAVESVRGAARAGENLMPALIEAAKANATLGETCEALKQVYGTWEEVAAL